MDDEQKLIESITPSKDEIEDLIPEVVETVSKEISTEVKDSSDLEEKAKADFDYARKSLYDVIDQGRNALEGLADLASAAEHPRVYEALSALMQSISASTKELIELQKSKKDFQKGSVKEEEKKQQNIQTQNNLFMGTNEELLKMLKDLNK